MSDLRPALTLCGLAVLGPVRVPHWEKWFSSVTSWLPLLATGASLFVVKAADKLHGC